MGSLLRAMRTQLEEFQSRLLVHLPFEFNESAARAGAASCKKASRKRKLSQKSALVQLALVHTFAMHTSLSLHKIVKTSRVFNCDFEVLSINVPTVDDWVAGCARPNATCHGPSIAICARVQPAHLPTRFDAGYNLSFYLCSHSRAVKFGSVEKQDALFAQSVARAPQHAFVRSALEKVNRGRGRTRSRLNDRQRHQIGGDRVARDAPPETLESDEEQRASCSGTERDMDRVWRYLHEHCLDERLRLREALVVERLLGTLQLNWPGALFDEYSLIKYTSHKSHNIRDYEYCTELLYSCSYVDFFSSNTYVVFVLMSRLCKVFPSAKPPTCS